MGRHKRNLLLLLSVIVALVVTAITTSHTQSQGVQQNRRHTPPSINPDQWPLVDYDRPELADAAERAKRQAKGKRYNRKFTAVAPNLTVTEDTYHWPLDFNALPVAKSDAIIVGTVTRAEAHLSSDRTGIYSEFTVRVDEVLKDRNSSPLAQGASIAVEREGGRVRFPPGNIEFVRVIGQGMPQLGHKYVLFLACNDAGDFDLLTGYELEAGKVRPLDWGTPHFELYEGWDEAPFINEVRNKIANPSRTPQQ